MGVVAYKRVAQVFTVGKLLIGFQVLPFPGRGVDAEQLVFAAVLYLLDKWNILFIFLLFAILRNFRSRSKKVRQFESFRRTFRSKS